MQMCVPSSPEGCSAKSEVSLDVAVSIHRRGLGTGLVIDAVQDLCVLVFPKSRFTLAFTPVYLTGLSPEYCCLERTVALCSTKLDSVLACFSQMHFNEVTKTWLPPFQQ